MSCDESLLDCWRGLNKALINMIVFVCLGRGAQEHVFSMIASHLPGLLSKGTLAWFRKQHKCPVISISSSMV